MNLKDLSHSQLEALQALLEETLEEEQSDFIDQLMDGSIAPRDEFTGLSNLEINTLIHTYVELCDLPASQVDQKLASELLNKIALHTQGHIYTTAYQVLKG